MFCYGVINNSFFIRKTIPNERENNTKKMLKKAHIQQKLSCDILKNMLDMDVMFFGGSKHIPWPYFEAITKSPTHQTPETSSPLVSTILVDQDLESVTYQSR